LGGRQAKGGCYVEFVYSSDELTAIGTTLGLTNLAGRSLKASIADLHPYNTGPDAAFQVDADQDPAIHVAKFDSYRI
jgi:hypothetical protein